jgi:hypothetical protein
VSASKEGGDWHLEAGALGKYSSHLPPLLLLLSCCHLFVYFVNDPNFFYCKCLDSDRYNVEMQDLDFHKGLRIKYMLPKIISETFIQVLHGTVS